MRNRYNFNVNIQLQENETQPKQSSRLEALDINRSFIVQAPAGSGKTSLLTQRFLSLLASVEKNPEECLALTFTKKAATEMRDRILAALEMAEVSEPSIKSATEPPTESHALLTWQLSRKVLERDQKENWNLLLNPERLRVLTLDAFAAQITRMMPIDSGIGFGFSITETPEKYYLQAAENLLLSLDEPELETVLMHLDNRLDLVQELFADMLAHREQWLPYVGQSLSFRSDELRKALEKSLRTVTELALVALVESIPKDCDEILPLAAFAAAELKKETWEKGIDEKETQEKETQEKETQEKETRNKPSDIIYCESLSNHQWPGKTLSESDIKQWRGLKELLLTEAGTLRKTVTHAQGFPAKNKAQNKEEALYFQTMKESMLSVLEKLDNVKSHAGEFLDNLRNFDQCPPLVYEEDQWQILESLLKLLPVLVAELQLVFQEEQVIDFPEVALAAQRALGELEAPSDLALHLDYRIRHLLVDEFQDTSISQLRLLELLTQGFQNGDGRTLFLVGDPMQSIYRFRQADVGIFLKVKQQGLGSVFLTPLTLTENFRSDPLLIDWTNQVFSEVFPKKEDIVTGAIQFQPGVSTRPSDEDAAMVTHHVTLENEASFLLDCLAKNKTQCPNSTVALLVRSRSHLEHLLPVLKREHIPYQGIELELLYQKQTIRDLLAISRAMVHLGDRIAWLALLRSPVFCLSLEDLYYIANFQDNLPIWWSVERFYDIPHLSLDAKEKLEPRLPIIRHALEQRECDSFRNWIFDLWQSLGGVDLLVENSKEALEETECFFNLLEAHEKQFDFFALGALDKFFQTIYDKPKNFDPAALQIMTIHKAKGLEFDTVILAGLGRRARSDKEKLLLWEEQTAKNTSPYLLLAPIKSSQGKSDPIYQYLKIQQQKRAEFEAQRLLYVAMTRARKRLYCLTHEELEFDSMLT